MKKLKILLLVVSLICVTQVFSQAVTKLMGDTILASPNGMATGSLPSNHPGTEWRLRNLSRINKGGLLTNIDSNGLTRFIRPRKSGDTLFVGLDTFLVATPISHCDTIYTVNDSTLRWCTCFGCTDFHVIGGSVLLPACAISVDTIYRKNDSTLTACRSDVCWDIPLPMIDSNFAIKDLTNWTGGNRYHNFKGYGLTIDSTAFIKFSKGIDTTKFIVKNTGYLTSPVKIAVWDNDTLKHSDISSLITATSWRTPLMASFGTIAGINASTTLYAQINGRSASHTAIESQTQFVVSEPCTAARLFVKTSNGQSASGSYVITLRVNGAGSTLSITIPANTAAGTFSDLTHTVSLNAGDLIDYELRNNATSSVSAVILSIGTSLTGVF